MPVIVDLLDSYCISKCMGFSVLYKFVAPLH